MNRIFKALCEPLGRSRLRRSAWFFSAVFILLIHGDRSDAQVLVQRSFNLILEGDDPGEGFDFDLPLDNATPIRVMFEGSFQNLDAIETGVRYVLSWPSMDGAGEQGVISSDFVRLPGSASLLLQFDHPIAFTPDNLRFFVEGGGPADHFRFVGDFTVYQVPEPAACVVTFAALGMLFQRRPRREMRIPF